jgi:hypothetical protein
LRFLNFAPHFSICRQSLKSRADLRCCATLSGESSKVAWYKKLSNGKLVLLHKNHNKSRVKNGIQLL